MIYPYLCPSCGNEFEVIKSVKEIDDIENCTACGTISNRTIARMQAVDATSAADWNARTYNPAFGKAVTPMEAKKIAKHKNWTEVGTEPVEKIQKHFKADRDRKQKDRWNKLNMNLGDIK